MLNSLPSSYETRNEQRELLYYMMQTKQKHSLQNTCKSNLDGATKSVWNIKIGTKSTCISANTRLHRTIKTKSM